MLKIEDGDARATASFDFDLDMIGGAGLYKQISRCIRMQFGVEASALTYHPGSRWATSTDDERRPTCLLVRKYQNDCCFQLGVLVL